MRRLSTLNLFLQSLIVVTGGVVRLTGSGLGCSTWPECTPGSYAPTPNQPESSIHKWVEFSNRLLTFLLFIVALILVAAIIRSGARQLRFLGATQILGILAQAILGGITVLTGLNPVSVAAHFLLSILIIAAALTLRQSIYEIASTTPTLLSRKLLKAHLTLSALVIVMGTIVTGSGPHAGDTTAVRFNFDARTISWLHADLVLLLIGLTFALYISVRSGEAKEVQKILKPRIRTFLFVALAQGGIGYLQYFTGLPEAIVALHLCGAVLVWLTAWNIALAGKVIPLKNPAPKEQSQR